MLSIGKHTCIEPPVTGLYARGEMVMDIITATFSGISMLVAGGLGFWVLVLMREKSALKDERIQQLKEAGSTSQELMQQQINIADQRREYAEDQLKRLER